MPYLKTLDQRHGIRISGSAVTVGSEPDNHIPIRPPFVVAPKQFTLVESGGRYLIQNTDPSGRTHVNGQPVTEVWLRDGDVIHAGELALLYMEDKEGDEDPALKQQRPSTPFQTEVQMLRRRQQDEDARSNAEESTCAPTMLLETPPDSQAEEEQPPTNYDDVAISSLAPGVSTATLNSHATGSLNGSSATKNSSEARRRKTRLLTLTLVLAAAALVYRQNDVAMRSKFPNLMGTVANDAANLMRQPTPLSAELDEHLKAVQLVATLPPETYSSLALSEFMAKTKSPWIKDRVEKQLLRALAPLVKNTDDVERITLLDAAQATSRILVITLKGRPSLEEVMKGVGDSIAQPITVSGMKGSRISNGTSEVRHVVEASPGSFVVSDIPLERLTMRFDLANRVGRPTGIVAMARQWPGGFQSSVNPVKLYDYGLEKDATSLTRTPIVSIDFEPLPQASVILPTASDVGDRLKSQWNGNADDVATRIASLGIIHTTDVCAADSLLQLAGEMQAATLLDDIWRKHFTDLDLKFRPITTGLAASY